MAYCNSFLVSTNSEGNCRSCALIILSLHLSGTNLLFFELSSHNLMVAGSNPTGGLAPLYPRPSDLTHNCLTRFSEYPFQACVKVSAEVLMAARIHNHQMGKMVIKLANYSML